MPTKSHKALSGRELDVAVLRFIAWLGRAERPRRRPLPAAAIAYIRACGGAVWR